MGLFSGITKSITKPIKKALKSPLGKAALLAAAYHFGPAALQPGQGLRGLSGWQKALTAKAPWLYSAGEAGSRVGESYIPYSPSGGILGKAANVWRGMGPLQRAATIGVGTAGVAGATLPEEDKLPEELTDDSGQQQYLTNRALFEDEWAEWLVDVGKAGTKEEALVMVRENPMFSQGGRVKAQGGLFAGQMPGRHPGMNQMRNPNMNPMGMNQGLGAPNLGPRSMGMTPGGGGGQMDPRMAQLMQGQKLQGARRTGAVPKESEDTELIQLIKLLTSLGIPMEQLRGRTKEDLVELLVSVSGKMGGGQETIEGEIVEEKNGQEAEAVEEKVVQAAQGGRIGYQDRGFVEDVESNYKMEPNYTMQPRYTTEQMFSGEMRQNLLEKLQEENEDATYEELMVMLNEQYGLAQGGIARTRYAMGTEHPIIPSKDGNQLDMRDRGGYQPHGKAEKHDDVRALLAQGEFVMTSDAVKGMGGGDREAGAKKMYNLMHNMEAMA